MDEAKSRCARPRASQVHRNRPSGQGDEQSRWYRGAGCWIGRSPDRARRLGESRTTAVCAAHPRNVHLPLCASTSQSKYRAERSPCRFVLLSHQRASGDKRHNMTRGKQKARGADDACKGLTAGDPLAGARNHVSLATTTRKRGIQEDDGDLARPFRKDLRASAATRVQQISTCDLPIWVRARDGAPSRGIYPRQESPRAATAASPQPRGPHCPLPSRRQPTLGNGAQRPPSAWQSAREYQIDHTVSL